MREDESWLSVGVLVVVAGLLGFAVGIVADAAVGEGNGAPFLGLMSAVAYLTLAFRR